MVVQAYNSGIWEQMQEDQAGHFHQQLHSKLKANLHYMKLSHTKQLELMMAQQGKALARKPQSLS